MFIIHTSSKLLCSTGAGVEGGVGGQVNQPSALALGLKDGSVCLWDVSSPARTMLTVLGQHRWVGQSYSSLF